MLETSTGAQQRVWETWARPMLEMTRSWTETQVRFSESWFELL